MRGLSVKRSPKERRLGISIAARQVMRRTSDSGTQRRYRSRPDISAVGSFAPIPAACGMLVASRKRTFGRHTRSTGMCQWQTIERHKTPDPRRTRAAPMSRRGINEARGRGRAKSERRTPVAQRPLQACREACDDALLLDGRGRSHQSPALDRIGRTGRVLNASIFEVHVIGSMP